MFKEMFIESVNEKYTGRQKALKRQNKSSDTGDSLGTLGGKQASKDNAVDILARKKMNDDYAYPIMSIYFKLMKSQEKRNPLITDEGWEMSGGDDMPEAGHYAVSNNEGWEVRLEFSGPTGYDRDEDVYIKVSGPNGTVYKDNISSKNISPKDLFKKAKKSLIKANSIFTEASEEVLLSNY